MPSYSKNEIILVRYPFSDLTATKVRPAVIVGVLDRSSDLLIVPLTSRTTQLALGEFVLTDWRGAGLNLPSAIKRGVYTVHASLILKSIGHLTQPDAQQTKLSLRQWLDL